MSRPGSGRVEWRQIRNAQNALSDQLGQDPTRCQCIENASDTIAGGQIFALKSRWTLSAASDGAVRSPPMPTDFWQSFLPVDHLTVAKIWGAIIERLVAVIAFECSVGNIPLAAVHWNGGISSGT